MQSSQLRNRIMYLYICMYGNDLYVRNFVINCYLRKEYQIFTPLIGMQAHTKTHHNKSNDESLKGF